MRDEFKIDRARLKPVPVGNSIWEDFSQTCYTVDKTLLVKELIDDGTTVALFTRPRRFGKTTALRMLKAFFEKTPKDTSFLFRPFKIWAAGERYRAEQGRYPVLYLTFKDIDGETFDQAFAQLKMCLARLVGQHRHAVAELDDAEDVARLERVSRERGSVEDCGAALGLLAAAVHRHCEKSLADGEDPAHAKPVIFIDEYDMPVNRASTNGYLREMTAFMRQFLSGALKDNVHVRMGVMTGVLRVAKEGILSGLNNLKVWTVFSRRYVEYFGFTASEVEALASFYGAAAKMPEIKSWYDGYAFGGREIYNPWSVLSYFDNDCDPKPYWLDTSSNDVIAEIVRDLPHDTAETLEALLRDGRALVPMTQELGPYAQIRDQPETLYALLVSSGYLKIVPSAEGEETADERVWVTIPNREIEKVFVADIVSKARRYTGRGEADAVAVAVIRRDPVAFRDAIRRFLVESASYFDGAAEGFYHGMVLGFLAVLRNRYKVRSNREAGDGRYDIALTPLVKELPGVVIEIKATKNESDDLKALAAKARRQIDEMNYAAEMAAEGVSDVLKLGLAFSGKQVEVEE